MLPGSSSVAIDVNEDGEVVGAQTLPQVVVARGGPERWGADVTQAVEAGPIGALPVEAEPGWPLNNDTYRDRYTTTQVVDYLQQDSADRPFLAVADLVTRQTGK